MVGWRSDTQRRKEGIRVRGLKIGRTDKTNEDTKTIL